MFDGFFKRECKKVSKNYDGQPEDEKDDEKRAKLQEIHEIRDELKQKKKSDKYEKQFYFAAEYYAL